MKILFIDCDTLRPDHLGCYGYQRPTSPYIDSIARDGICYQDYYCSDAPCLPSRAALVTGRFGIHTGVVGHGGTAADMRLDGEDRIMMDTNTRDNLPAVMKRYGMHTASVSSFPERHGAWWFNAGFNECYNVGKRGLETADEVTPYALDWLERNKNKEDWFLHVHYWDPHTPYRTPLEEGNPFETIPLPREEWMNEELLKEHRDKEVGPHSAQELSMYDDAVTPLFPRQLGQIRTMKDYKKNIDDYDTGIWYMDKHIGKLLDWLKAEGCYEDTAIIITADHGEDLGELGEYDEHGSADYPTTHIPMIIKWPGGIKNHMSSGLHYNLDLLPTLKELLGPMPAAKVSEKIVGVCKEPEYDGISYAQTLLEGKDGGREYLVVSQCAHVCQRAVRFDDWMYIRTYHDGFHLHPQEMLFNIKEDPHQLKDLAKEKKEFCWKGTYLLDQWYTENMKKMVHQSQTDPMWTVIAEGGPFHSKGHLPEYLKRLENTGRSWAAKELAKRHPEVKVRKSTLTGVN
ncbi:sulfatase [Anaerocolumna sp. AGMB13025]|uniref:sulfatase n=1 Tax=Anaerocolumna sp. AGMB13025 TaxID=3039116 RepID=UPI00241CE413|nr:sulfatase [Anaerocolumna sp. AGMB13025]WFR59918.1 sulfatase [Anaerocolumna sp. AGMB13025]